MAISVTEICNLALSRIGAKRINDFDEDTNEAIQCRTHYEVARDSLLRSHAWNFATTFATLSRDTATPLYHYKYQYLLPADMLRILGMENRRWPWIVSGDRVFTDQEVVNIEYVRKVTAPTEFDAMFVDVLALGLALRLVSPLSQDKALRQQIEQEYMDAMARARTVNMQESNHHRRLTWNGSRFVDASINSIP